ncbi:MAG: [Clostridia bacterium]|nr:[FeFe] hydrogenase H-cluster maturation GTPase HydF [Clostridia bacterium]
MGLNSVVSAERVHIGFFGLRNAGKSSLVNAVTGQELALVSDVLGTTTDPVKKAMELLPLGPVVIIDTPGTDDEGELGMMRVKRAKQVLNYADVAVLVVDAAKGMSELDGELVAAFESKKLPYVIAYNKADLLAEIPQETEKEIYVSAVNKLNIERLKEKIASAVKSSAESRCIVADLINAGDTVVLVTPIDESAPKGRLILPQQQTIRDILDTHATAIVTRETELAQTLDSLKNPPALVITDSQAFGVVSKIVPSDIPLTSFSILFARYKGNLNILASGAKHLDLLKDGDKVLISEGCTHHRQCNDIGTVKLPGWIEKHSGKKLEFEFTSGGEFPQELSPYTLIVHCGGCMLNEREVQYRLRQAADAGVPITNYGTAIAYMNGILGRSLKVFEQN